MATRAPGPTRQRPPTGREHDAGALGADLLVLCVVAVLAYALDWSAGDLAWSMWLASLVLATGGVLVGLVALAFSGRGAGAAAAPPRWILAGQQGVAILAGLFAGAAFAFAFFFLHMLYAIVLHFAFPLLPDVSDAFALGREGELVRLLIVAGGSYWPFVVAAGVGERDHLVRSLRTPGVESVSVAFRRLFRMHFFMFVAVGMLVVGGTGYLFYLVTLVFFQLPWGALARRFLEGGRGAQGNA